MALIFMDGFDHYAAGDILQKWDEANIQALSTTYGRNGTKGTYCSRFGSLKKTIPSSATVILGVAYQCDSFASGYEYFMWFREGATDHVYFLVNASGYMVAYRGGGTLLATGTIQLSTTEFKYVEVKVTIHDTTGAIQTRINGITDINISGVDTRNGGTSGVVDTAWLGHYNMPSAQSLAGRYDDVYMLDTSGSSNNDFLGDVRIKTIFPTAEGTNSAWTPLSGTDNALMVDDATPDGDTTYVSTDTVNARDTHVIQDVSTSGGTVFGVAVNVVARREGDTVRKIKSTIKSSATYGLGAEKTLTATYLDHQGLYDVDPNGSVAWTETTVNAIEAGVDLTV